MDIDRHNLTGAVIAALLMEELLGGYDDSGDSGEEGDERPRDPRNGEQNDVVTATTLVNVYISWFARPLRTNEFMKLFELCFGTDSYICSKHPQPVACKDCLTKYIKNCNSLIECSMNDEVVKTYKNIILPRLTDLHDMFDIIMEGMSFDTTLENILTVLDIDAGHYDPPSEEVMAKCEKYKFTKREKEDDICAICQCDMEEGEDVHKLVCTHLFHEECIGHWLKDNSTCPICKFSLK